MGDRPIDHLAGKLRSWLPRKEPLGMSERHPSTGAERDETSAVAPSNREPRRSVVREYEEKVLPGDKEIQARGSGAGEMNLFRAGCDGSSIMHAVELSVRYCAPRKQSCAPKALEPSFRGPRWKLALGVPTISWRKCHERHLGTIQGQYEKRRAIVCRDLVGHLPSGRS